MTQSTRTVAQIEAAMSSCEGFIEQAEIFLRDLRATPWQRGYVTGFPQYGLFLHEDQEGLASVLAARVLQTRNEAWRLAVRNRKGERAEIMRRDDAIDAVISLQEDHVTSLWGMYRDLEEELCALLDAAADAHHAAEAAADAAYWDAQADEAAYYDGVSLHWADRRDADDCYEQRRDEKAERDADARQDR